MSASTGAPEERRGRTLTPRTAAVTTALQFAARAVGAAVTVATLAVITRHLGPVRFADWATVLTVVTTLAFLPDPGISPVVVRRLAQDIEEAPRPGAILAVRLALGVAAWALSVGVAIALRGTDVGWLAVVLAAQLIPRAAIVDAGAWLQIDHLQHVQALLEAIAAAVGLALLTLAAQAGAGIVELAAAGVLAPLVLLAVALQLDARRRRRDRALPARGPRAERLLIRAVLSEALPLAVGVILISLYTRVNLVFVNTTEDATTIAAFLYAFQLVEQTLVFGGVIAAVLLPMLAASALDIPLDRAPVMGELIVGLALLGGLGAAAVVAFGESAVVVISGPGYAPAGRFLVLMAPAVIALLQNFLFAYAFVVAGRSARYMRYNGLGLGLVLVGNVAFTLSLGAGASARIAWAAEISVVLMAGVPFLSSRGNRLALGEMIAIFALVVASCELVAADVVDRESTAAGLGVVFAARLAVLLAGRRHRLRALAT